MISSLIKTTLIALVAGVLLQGCGSERDTPFNPGGTSSSSSSSLGTSITGFDRLRSGTKPITTPADLNKKLIAIRDEADMDQYWAAYVGFAQGDEWDKDKVDFELGQVLLIDRGQLGQCDDIISFDRLQLYDHTEHTVKAIIRFNETGRSSASSTSSSGSSSSYVEQDCDKGLGTINQPFVFYYIPSRKVLVFQENIN